MGVRDVLRAAQDLCRGGSHVDVIGTLVRSLALTPLNRPPRSSMRSPDFHPAECWPHPKVHLLMYTHISVAQGEPKI